MRSFISQNTLSLVPAHTLSAPQSTYRIMVEILNANDNLPVFEDRADLTVALNEVEFHPQLTCMNVLACVTGVTLLFFSSLLLVLLGGFSCEKRVFPAAAACSGFLERQH